MTFEHQSAQNSNPIFKFKNVEEDLGLAIGQIRDDIERRGILWDMDQWRSAHKIALGIVVDAYLARCEFDPIIDYCVAQWDAGGGDEYFLPISRCLTEARDTNRLLKLWRGVIANRRSANLKQQMISAMEHLCNAMRSVGDLAAFRQATAELDSAMSSRRQLPDVPLTDVITDLSFWTLVHAAKSDSVSTWERPHKLTQSLEKFSADSIEQFSTILKQKLDALYTFALWGVAYIARAGCGEKQFEYFRAWIISEGQSVFSKALSEPESVIEHINPNQDPQLPALLDSAANAYFARTHRQLRSNHQAAATPSGKCWREEELPVLYPRAWAKFNS